MRSRHSPLSGIIFSGLLLVLTNGVTVSAELYKWVDEHGVTQYSEQPPAGKADVQKLNLKVTPADPVAAEKLKAQVEGLDKSREARAEDEQIKRQVADAKAVNEENCRRAKARVAAYSIPNALIQQEDGSRTRVDEPTRQKELAASKDMVKTYCN